MSKTWSLITVTYNSQDALSRHPHQELPSSIEWIVVDNASDDGSVDVARALGAKVVSQSENLGFSAANNVGARCAEGEFLGFVNPDVVPNFADLPLLERELQSSGGIVAPQLTNDDGTLQPNGRGAPYLTRKVKNRLLIGDKGNERYRLYAPRDRVILADWVTGAALAMSAADFRVLGGWDERFFLYYEDTDICMRANSLNMPIRVVGDCRWSHSWARETATVAWQPWRNEVHSAIKFYRRYPKFLIPHR